MYEGRSAVFGVFPASLPPELPNDVPVSSFPPFPCLLRRLRSGFDLSADSAPIPDYSLDLPHMKARRVFFPPPLRSEGEKLLAFPLQVVILETEDYLCFFLYAWARVLNGCFFLFQLIPLGCPRSVCGAETFSPRAPHAGYIFAFPRSITNAPRRFF